MNSKEFNKLVEERCQKIKDVLASKGQEYTTDDNKLHNFDKAARMRNTSREKALDGFLLKHLVSLDDIINKIDNGIYPTKEVIDEKLGDVINYYVLLEACLVDRLEKRKQPLHPDEYFKIENSESFPVEGQDYYISLQDEDKPNPSLFMINDANNLHVFFHKKGEEPGSRHELHTEFDKKYKLWKKQEDS